LVRAVTVEAYRAGARYVDVHYSDPWIRRALVEEGAEDSLGWTPPWMVARLERGVEVGAAAVAIAGASNSDVFEGVDTTRLSRARFADLERFWLSSALDGKIAWTIVAAPGERWAREALGEPDVDRLWRAMAHSLRLDEPDPAAAWDRRMTELEGRAAELTERGFSALRYRGPGTELEVGLIEGARWLTGREETVHGQRHIANLPTEEVFTSPHRLRAEGTVRSTYPLALRGRMVEGLELRLSAGKIVEVRADAGADVVEAELGVDGGAPHLGELALVDSSSRVGEAGMVFRNTLFDENAASHIAWGQGIFTAVEGVLGADADDHAREAAGLNDSRTHVDFMVGGPEVDIDGVEPGGAAVPLLREGRWQLA
jgi:aminopeptidase